jgi:hypothetical protein
MTHSYILNHEAFLAFLHFISGNLIFLLQNSNISLLVISRLQWLGFGCGGGEGVNKARKAFKVIISKRKKICIFLFIFRGGCRRAAPPFGALLVLQSKTSEDITTAY